MLRMIKDNYDYIKSIDIYNYLKITKWCKATNLSISEMVNDIISIDIQKVDEYIKEKIKKESREI